MEYEILVCLISCWGFVFFLTQGIFPSVLVFHLSRTNGKIQKILYHHCTSWRVAVRNFSWSSQSLLLREKKLEAMDFFNVDSRVPVWKDKQQRRLYMDYDLLKVLQKMHGKVKKAIDQGDLKALNRSRWLKCYSFFVVNTSG